MFRSLQLLLYIIMGCVCQAQSYTASSIFAHNDYAQPVPLYAAYQFEVGFIEADIFLKGNELLVAHTQLELNKRKTLETLYLTPLSKLMLQNNGSIYPVADKTLTLMIDLKTEGVATLNVLVAKLKKFQPLLLCKTFKVAISGNVPDPTLWKNYPMYIYFDGRPGIAYTEDQLKRVNIISTSFKDHSSWNGKGVLSDDDRQKLTDVINATHAKGKPIRFWSIPDFANAWTTLMKLQVDIINTDDVAGLAAITKN